MFGFLTGALRPISDVLSCDEDDEASDDEDDMVE